MGNFKKKLSLIRNKFKFPIKISLLYFIISFLWILLFDRIALAFITDKKVLALVSTLKGWVYVIIISIALYLLLVKASKRIDIAETKLNQKYDELKVSEDRLMRAQEIAHVGNWEYDIQKKVLWASKEAYRIFGLSYTELTMPVKDVLSMIHKSDRAMMDEALVRMVEEQAEWNMEFRIIRNKGGEERIIHSVAKLGYDEKGNPHKILGVLMDITEEKIAQENVRRSHDELVLLYEKLAASDEELVNQFNQTQILAYNDSLTGLPNRLCLQERLTEIINNSFDKIALFYIDLDNFKNINDSYGHLFGDAALVEMGKRLTCITNENSFVARLGGDEFAIVVANIESTEKIRDLAGQMLTELFTSFEEKDKHIHMSASIGVAIYPEHASGFEELLKNADIAMYDAKKKGKRQFAVYSPVMNREVNNKTTMKINLRSAIKKNELIIYYQPVCSMKDSKVRGFEALLRWKSPLYGMLLPTSFIPLAEENGLITQIGKWVMNSACRFISKINSTREDKLVVSVNISVHQLYQPDFVEEVVHILADNNLSAEFLALEITESIFGEDTESNIRKIDELKKIGVRVALDDFGTGNSSITQLKELPISILKLDKAFIDDIAVNPTDNSIVKSIIRLADVLDLVVIAEGVEEKDQADCLEDFGCDLVQGYYFSEPVPEEQVLQLLKR